MNQVRDGDVRHGPQGVRRSGVLAQQSLIGHQGLHVPGEALLQIRVKDVPDDHEELPAGAQGLLWAAEQQVDDQLGDVVAVLLDVVGVRFEGVGQERGRLDLHCIDEHALGVCYRVSQGSRSELFRCEATISSTGVLLGGTYRSLFAAWR